MAVSLFRTDKGMKPIEAHRPTLSKQELESVLDCLINDRLGPGKIVQRFEKTFAATFSYKHVLAVNSRASAYHLALLALGVGEGKKVLMSALAPMQAFDAVRYTGAEPVLVDVDRNSFHPSPDKIRELLGKEETRPDVFILDHAFGSTSPITAELPREFNVKIVEDFTGLVGSELQEGEFPGNAGHVAVCGFSDTDLLTTGNGAVVVTSGSNVQKELQSLRYGSKRVPGSVAYDYRLSDFQAAIGIDQISRLGIVTARRKKIAQKYLATLRTTRHETYFQNPDVDGYLKFPVVINRPHDEVMRYFNSLQIGVSRVVEMPLHHLDDLPRLEFANAERIYQKGAAIPVYPSLTANNVERIASSLRGLL